MNKDEKEKILKTVKKAEFLINKGDSILSLIAELIQPYFEQEVRISYTTDGAMITDESGEIEPLKIFLEKLNNQ